MTFQLFDNLTPNTASQIETLVNDGFYNGDYIYRAQSRIRRPGRQRRPHDLQRNGDRHNNDQYVAFRRAVHDQRRVQSGPELYLGRRLGDGPHRSPNTSGTEFFIAEGRQRGASDYGYSLFGFQTVNQAITVNGKRRPSPGDRGRADGDQVRPSATCTRRSRSPRPASSPTRRTAF